MVGGAAVAVAQNVVLLHPTSASNRYLDNELKELTELVHYLMTTNG